MISTRRLIKRNHETITQQLSQSEKNTAAAVRQYSQSVEWYLRYLGPLILSKLDFISRFGTDLSNSTSQILSMTFAASKDLGIIRATVLRLDRGIGSGEHFVLEDATGRSFPIHFKTIISWDSFEFILADRFKGRKANVAPVANSTRSMRAIVGWKSINLLPLEMPLSLTRRST